MNTRKLQHIVTLASHGSYAGAARELNLSPSALSKSVHSLEEELNLVLFTRGKGGVFSTPAGDKVLNAAHRLLDSLTAMEDSLRGLSKAEWGDAAFGMAPVLSAIVLPSVFQQVLSEQKMRVQAIIEPGERLLELLNAGRIEFFMCTEGAVGRVPNVVLEPAGLMPLAMRVREGHPLAGHREVPDEELNRFPLVGGNFQANSRLRIYPHRPYEPTISCDNYQILAETTRTSDARCHFPSMMPTKGLVDVNCAPGTYLESIGLVAGRLRSRRLSRPAKAALERIQQVMTDLGLVVQKAAGPN
jgi:DNA-binding transcriptional LysR family regulator